MYVIKKVWQDYIIFNSFQNGLLNMGLSRPLFAVFSVLFTLYFKFSLKKVKSRCRAWDSSPEPQNCRRRRIHWATAAALKSFLCSLFRFRPWADTALCWLIMFSEAQMAESINRWKRWKYLESLISNSVASNLEFRSHSRTRKPMPPWLPKSWQFGGLGSFAFFSIWQSAYAKVVVLNAQLQVSCQCLIL